jgi:hypothetical protein
MHLANYMFKGTDNPNKSTKKSCFFKSKGIMKTPKINAFGNTCLKERRIQTSLQKNHAPTLPQQTTCMVSFRS